MAEIVASGVFLLVGSGRRRGEEDPLPPTICRPANEGAMSARVASPLALGPAPERSARLAVDAVHRLAEQVEAVPVRHRPLRATRTAAGRRSKPAGPRRAARGARASPGSRSDPLV